MAVTTRKNNPGFLSDEEIIASFCVRTSELTSLVEMLRESHRQLQSASTRDRPAWQREDQPAAACCSRGTPDDTLSDGFFPIVFAEESYEVATAGEFWLECLSRLAVQAPSGEGGP